MFAHGRLSSIPVTYGNKATECVKINCSTMGSQKGKF